MGEDPSTSARVMPGVLSRYPEKTEVVVGYLLSLGDSHGSEALKIVFGTIRDGGFHTEWEISWLLRVVLRHANQVSRDQIDILEGIARDEATWPTCRTGALKVLGACGVLDQPLVGRLWDLYSVCHHPDLVAALYLAGEHQPWATGFLEAARDDPVNGVILRHLSADQPD